MPVELGQVAGLPDVLMQDHFSFLVPNLPGGGNGQMLEILNMTATLPGRSNNAIPVELHRNRVHQAGKRTFGHKFSASYVDTKDKAFTQAFESWQNLITNIATGLPNPKADYMTTAVIRIYNADNTPAILRTFYGLYPESVPDQQLNGSSNSPLVFTVNFNYDYWLPGGF